MKCAVIVVEVKIGVNAADVESTGTSTMAEYDVRISLRRSRCSDDLRQIGTHNLLKC